jgi:catechol 2,3-dioxygenase-like lactoylglutathione lyase family enzyme
VEEQVALQKNYMVMKAIEIIIIPVADQQKAKEFYMELGFRVLVEARADHGHTWLQMSLPDDRATIALMHFHGIIVETPDIEKAIQEYKAKGIAFGKIDDQPYGRFAWVKDLDGNGLCLHQK